MSSITVQAKVKKWDTGFTAVFDGVTAFPRNIGESTPTACIELGDTSWTAKIYPGGIDGANAGHVSCMLSCESQETIRTVFTIHVIQNDGSCYTPPAQPTVQTFSGVSKIAGLKRLMSSAELGNTDSKLLDNGKLTVRVDITFLGAIEHTFLGAAPVTLESPIKYDPKDSSNALGIQLYQSLQNGEDCYGDVTLICDGGSFKAHKFVLTARSVVFERMFQTELKEAATNEVYMEDLNEETVQAFLCYCYTGNIPHHLMGDNAMPLLSIACMYEVDGLRKICEQSLLANINTSNALRLLNMADLYEVPQLKQQVLWYVAGNARSVLQADDCIDHLSKGLCLDLLRAVAGIGILNGPSSIGLIPHADSKESVMRGATASTPLGRRVVRKPSMSAKA